MTPQSPRMRARAVVFTFRTLALLGALSTGAFADQLTHTDSIPLTPTNWTDSVSVPKFDARLGTLSAVRIEFDAQVEGTAAFESLDNSSATVTTTLSADIRLFAPGPGMVRLLQAAPQVMNSDTVTGFDGVIDFGGTSGRTYPNLATTITQSIDIPPGPPSLDAFIGRGMLTFPVTGIGQSLATGSGNIVSQFTTRAGATIRVIYTFAPPIVDCNGNGIDDRTDIANGTSADCDQNGIPDECQLDCDGDGVPDVCGDPCECEDVGRRTPGSLLLFPEFDNRDGNMTLVTVTNTNCDLVNGTVDVEFVYIGRYGPNGQDLQCLEFNRTRRLSPCDTITLWTDADNPNQDQGYLYVFAKDPVTHEPIVFNHLIGQLLFVGGAGNVNDSLNAVPFRGIGAERASTNHDGDDVRDLDGIEYSEAPDRLLIPRFLGQDDELFQSRLILIGLSGGTAFTTSVDFLIYNDNEEVFSANYSFYCWEKPLLTEISNAFRESFLDSTSHAPGEILGAAQHEAGWFRIDGALAQSSAAQIDDPAIYAVLVEQVGIHSVADLPFELCTQSNGDLLPNGLFGDV